MKELRELSELEVGIGFQRGTASRGNGTDITDIAMWNEFGTEHIPSRPFMRDSVDKHIPAIEHMLKAQEGALLNGASARKVLETVGVFQKDLMQTEIEQGDFVANAEATIKRKGSDKPLIDTGQMKNSVNFWIQKKGSGR
ncbi:MAG: hypothetical protein HFI95_16390 [Lachnospiraceae bacterium]|nr:hypothetical protein [Lachnospiraceae bacterium]